MNGRPATLHDWLQVHSSPFLDRRLRHPVCARSFSCASAAPSGSTSRTIRRCCASRGASSRSTSRGSSRTTSIPPPRLGTSTRTAALSTLARTRARGPISRASTRGSAFTTSQGCTAAQRRLRRHAEPSLAYALIVVLEGWAVLQPFWRGASIGFFVSMAFSAMYLDHHWVLDAVAGIVYCPTVVTVRARLRRARASRARSRPAVADERAARRRAMSRTHEPGSPGSIATWFGCGLVPKAPGTMGASARSRSTCSSRADGRAGVAAGALAVTASASGRRPSSRGTLGKKDPQIVVVDEVAGMLVTMLPMRDVSWRGIPVGFLLFRLFDVTQAMAARRFEALPEAGASSWMTSSPACSARRHGRTSRRRVLR